MDDAWRQALHRLRLEGAWGVSHLRRHTQRAAEILQQQAQAAAAREAESAAQPSETVAAQPAAATVAEPVEPAAADQARSSLVLDADVEAGATSWSLTAQEAATLAPAQRQALIEQRLAEMAEQVATCSRCPKLRERRRPAFSDGTPHTPLMFVGEAPGEQEDKSGVPFVGRAGQKLTEIIEKGLAHAIRQITGRNDIKHVPRSSVYIANVLKCRPPGNRDPEPAEVENCREYLSGQIDLVRPKVICALGLPATRRLTGQDRLMGSMRGKRYPLPERPEITVIPTYHPAYLLQNFTPDNRRKVLEDITEVAKALTETTPIPWW